MSKSVIIIGGGKSVRDGINTGLWDKIKDMEVWGLNYAYKLYPHKLDRQLFVDFNFYRSNEEELQKLAATGVPFHAKKHSKFRVMDVPFITAYNSVREQGGFRGKDALKEPPEAHIFVGRLGLVGTFSLSLAIAEGYDTIYLLGYDFGTPEFKDRDTHWYQGQIDVKSSGVGRPTVYYQPDATLKNQVKDYDVFPKVEGVNIYNVSPLSNIQCLKKINYSEFYNLIGGKDE